MRLGEIFNKRGYVTMLEIHDVFFSGFCHIDAIDYKHKQLDSMMRSEIYDTSRMIFRNRRFSYEQKKSNIK